MEQLSKQLILSTQSGRLKPDVRLGVAVSEFAQSLDDDRKRQFQKMRTAGTQLSGRDAIRVTEELNRDSERKHSAWRPYGTKCGKFLDRLQTLATIGDVMIGGSQNVIATSIWCAVRLSLQTATNFRGYFERLSGLFMKLGTSWDLHNDFAQIFPQSKDLQNFLCEYLIVLMRLCRKTVVFSNMSLAGQLWSSLGASFDSEFKPLQEEMDMWGLMIQNKTQQLATACVVDAEKFRRRDYKQRTLHLLSPNQPHHVTTWRRHRRKGDCKWVFQTDAYKSWIAEDASSTMCISGKLGSGKTVTMANIVAQINMHQTCAFFFYSFKDQESLKATTVLGSMACHLLDNIPGDDSTWDALATQEDTTSRVLTSTGIIRLLIELLPEHSRYVVAFDGLEDCPNDEITEVIYGLRRLMASRKVLLCCPARSGSRFHQLTAEKLAVKFSLSLDENMHHEEIKAYIIEEVSRRKQSSQAGLFSDELTELVKKQLLAGAQGMYLWVSLQLETIFPSQSRTVITYEQILNSINNLPRDLPQSFERALEDIIDDRYGNSIMKIVMAARSPLSLDELSVALAVVPGDPVWYAAKTPTNSSQLIALCGGNLLELDEEDGKVRFIHYSVVSHLLQTTNNPHTMQYHFSMQEAEIQSGAICVTFLNMPIFETAVTMTRKIDGEKLADKVIGAAAQEQPVFVHLAQRFKRKDRHQYMPTEFDIGRLLAEIQATSMLRFDPHCFQNYAVSNWLPHSRSFERGNPMCTKIWHLWIRLFCGNIHVAVPPFQNPAEESWSALSWALENHHKPLIYVIFDEPSTEPTDWEKISQGVVELALPSSAKRHDSSSLGLVLVHLFQLAANILMPGHKIGGEGGTMDHVNVLGPTVTWILHEQYSSLQQLLDLGADPTIPHSRHGINFLQMLLATLGHVSEKTIKGLQLRDLLTRALECGNTQHVLRSAWVPSALRGILEHDNTQIFATLLSYHPYLHTEPDEDSLVGVAVAKGNDNAVRALIKAWPESGDDPARSSYIDGQPAIQLALEMHNREMVVLLAHHGGLNTGLGVKQFSAPLLQIALDRMSVEWVELLLQLGADPNLGYLAILEEPMPHKEVRYHLQIAAERSQTLQFLTLVCYGADPSLPAFPTISDILLQHYNPVLMTRLKEMDFFEPTKCSKALSVGSRDGLPPSSALLEACKMLALSVNENETLMYFGLIQSHGYDIQPKGQQLKLIILDLAKTTQPERLNIQCQEGNTALHYLTGGMDTFHKEALAVALRFLTFERARHGLILKNKYGQTPLRRAIENASRHNWSSRYTNNVLFLLSHIRTEELSTEVRTEGDDNILGFAISRGAPVDQVVRVLLNAGCDPNGTLRGATPLNIAYILPWDKYRSEVVHWLLRFGADPSRGLKASLSYVALERRDWLTAWLRDSLSMPYSDYESSVRPVSSTSKHVGVPEWTAEEVPMYELDDTSTRLSEDAQQRRCDAIHFQIHNTECQSLMRDSSPARSAKAVCGGSEENPIYELEDTSAARLLNTFWPHFSAYQQRNYNSLSDIRDTSNGDIYSGSET